jgi:hypothetical protein
MSSPQPAVDTSEVDRSTGKAAFISHSRRDRVFVRRLYEAMEAVDRTPWVDWEDIEVTAPFLEEIYAGIDAADAFVFVISPDSVTSDICLKELRYASDNNKRIIPIARRHVDPAIIKQLLPDQKGDEIAESNWVRARKNESDPKCQCQYASDKEVLTPDCDGPDCDLDVFEVAVDSLLRALDIDLDYIRKHRDLLVQAHRWQVSDSDRSGLLRGNALNRAEDWLLKPHLPDEGPTEVQRDYILVSRQTETRRQRRILGIAVATAVIMLILAVVANVFRESADREATRASNEADRANEEATEAVRQRNNAQQSLQTLAIDLRTIEIPVGARPNSPVRLGLDLWVSHRDDGTLWQLAADSGQPRREPIMLGGQSQMPVTDGKYLWISRADTNTLIRIDPQDPTDLLNIDVGAFPHPPVIAGQWAWVFSETSLVQIDRQSGASHQTITLPRGTQPPVYDEPYLWLLNPNERILMRVHQDTGDVFSIPTERDPQHMVIANEMVWLTRRFSNRIQRWSAATGDPASSIDFGVELDIPMFANGSLWIIAFEEQKVFRINPENEQDRGEFDIGRQIKTIYPYRGRLWVFTADDGLLSYDAATGSLVSAIQLAGSFNEPAFDGEHMWLTNRAEDSILMIRLRDGQHVRTLPMCTGPGTPYFDSTNMWIPCENENTIARIPALLSYYEIGVAAANPEPQAPIFDGQYLWVLQESQGSMIQFDGQQGAVLDEIDVGSNPGEAMFDGRYLWVVADDRVTRIEPGNDNTTAHIPINRALGGDVLRVGDYAWIAFVNHPLAAPEPDFLMVHADTLEVKQERSFGIGALPPVYDADEAVIWVSSENGIYRIDVTTGEILTETALGMLAYEALLTPDSAWIVGLLSIDINDLMQGALQGEIEGNLFQLQRSDGTLMATIPLEELPSAVIEAGGYLWLAHTALAETDAADGSLVAIDPATQTVVGRWALCDSVNRPFFDGTFVWAVCLSIGDHVGKIVVLDPASLSIVQEYDDLGLGAWPAQRIGDQIWVVHQRTGNAAIFQAQSGELIRVLGFGERPAQAVVGSDGYVWIANTGDGTVQRVRLDE